MDLGDFEAGFSLYFGPTGGRKEPSGDEGTDAAGVSVDRESLSGWLNRGACIQNVDTSSEYRLA